MIDTNKLRGIMAENNTTGKDLAEAMGIDKNTFYNKMRKGVFDSDEIQTMIELLHIDEPVPVFFAPNVTQEVTKSDMVQSDLAWR